MKKVAALLLALGFASSSALGGVVRFEQTSPDPSWFDTTVTFDVWIDSSDVFPAGFRSVDVIMGSNDGLVLTSFVMSQAIFVFTGVDTPAVPQVYESDIKAGGFAIAKVGLPMLLGVLTVDVGDPVTDPKWKLMVDATIDGDRSKLQNSSDPGVVDPLFGWFQIPEPGTLSLLALASLAFIRRRKAA